MKKALAVLALSATLAMTAGSGFAAAGSGPDKSPQPEGNVAPAMVDTDSNKVFDDLELMLAGKGANDKVAVIVRLNEAFEDHKLAQIENKSGNSTRNIHSSTHTKASLPK